VKHPLFYGRTEPEVPDPGGRLPTALVVPGGERLAVSTLGWQAVYRILAQEPQLAVERVFPDKRGRGDSGGPPASKESQRPLSSFPVIALSVTYEEQYLFLVRALGAAGIPLLAQDRKDFPLIMVGGPPTFLNPAPIARFVDLFWVGEANENSLPLFLDLKQHIFAGGTKNDFLESVKSRPGIYVPGRSTTPVRRVISNPGRTLPDPAFSCFTSNTATFRDTFLLEINRGCPYGCRFCAAGYIYRPPRHSQRQRMQELVEAASPRKVGLVGTALTDWPELLPFLKWLHGRKMNFSLSSLRADGITEELMIFLRKCGIRTITLALEGASERLRNVASKKLDIENFLNAVRFCARHGVNHLKIYLIVGWPGETDADYDELEALLRRITDIRKQESGESKKHFMRITISASCLVPKPFTPFQWAPMPSESTLDRRLRKLRRMVKPMHGISLQHDSPFQARLQGMLARGDGNLADFIILAAEHGGWKKAFQQWNGSADEYLRERKKNESFPWEVIDVGIRRDYLYREWELAKQAKQSPGCSSRECEACRRCGMEDY